MNITILGQVDKRAEACRITGLANRKHGMTHTRTYRSWRAMRGRCTKPNHKDYPLWGGKGIKVCERWQESFENFYEDMGERPIGTSIDRIDGNGDYNKDNCRWATPREQSSNTTQNRNISQNGIVLNISAWARARGVNRKVIYRELEEGLFTET